MNEKPLSVDEFIAKWGDWRYGQNNDEMKADLEEMMADACDKGFNMGLVGKGTEKIANTQNH